MTVDEETLYLHTHTLWLMNRNTYALTHALHMTVDEQTLLHTYTIKHDGGYTLTHDG